MFKKVLNLLSARVGVMSSNARLNALGAMDLSQMCSGYVGDRFATQAHSSLLWAPDFPDKDECDLGIQGQYDFVMDTERLDHPEFVARLWGHLTWTPDSTDWHGVIPMRLTCKG